MHLICDVDDVLLDWLGGFKGFLKKEEVPHKEGDPKDWDMTDWLHGIDYGPLIEKFNRSKEFGELEPVPGSVEAQATLDML